MAQGDKYLITYLNRLPPDKSYRQNPKPPPTTGTNNQSIKFKRLLKAGSKRHATNNQRTAFFAYNSKTLLGNGRGRLGTAARVARGHHWQQELL